MKNRMKIFKDLDIVSKSLDIFLDTISKCPLILKKSCDINKLIKVNNISTKQQNFVSFRECNGIVRQKLWEYETLNLTHPSRTEN